MTGKYTATESINLQLLCAATLPDFHETHSRDVVCLWRRSFQRAMGLTEQNEPVELDRQLTFFQQIPLHRIWVAWEHSGNELPAKGRPGCRLAGFIVLNAPMVEHLYVAPCLQARGIGKVLLNHAKASSPAGLELFTFARNRGAQAFYLSQGFVEVARGVAARADNPWADSAAALRDIEYRWSGNTGWFGRPGRRCAGSPAKPVKLRRRNLSTQGL